MLPRPYPAQPASSMAPPLLASQIEIHVWILEASQIEIHVWTLGGGDDQGGDVTR